jgi:hypothetical protein
MVVARVVRNCNFDYYRNTCFACSYCAYSACDKVLPNCGSSLLMPFSLQYHLVRYFCKSRKFRSGIATNTRYGCKLKSIIVRYLWGLLYCLNRIWTTIFACAFDVKCNGLENTALPLDIWFFSFAMLPTSIVFEPGGCFLFELTIAQGVKWL